jgi:hypothetical protein
MTANDDRDLLRTLARACGWKVSVTDNVLYHFAHDTQGAALTIGADSSADAWAKLLSIVPTLDWLNSVDAALALPWPEDCELSTWSSRNSYDAYLKVWDGNNEIDKREYTAAPTLARALCECFAQWWKAKEAGI